MLAAAAGQQQFRGDEETENELQHQMIQHYSFYQDDEDRSLDHDKMGRLNMSEIVQRPDQQQAYRESESMSMVRPKGMGRGRGIIVKRASSFRGGKGYSGIGSVPTKSITGFNIMGSLKPNLLLGNKKSSNVFKAKLLQGPPVALKNIISKGVNKKEELRMREIMEQREKDVSYSFYAQPMPRSPEQQMEKIRGRYLIDKMRNKLPPPVQYETHTPALPHRKLIFIIIYLLIINQLL